jgi:hypothetical protein
MQARAWITLGCALAAACGTLESGTTVDAPDGGPDANAPSDASTDAPIDSSVDAGPDGASLVDCFGTPRGDVFFCDSFDDAGVGDSGLDPRWTVDRFPELFTVAGATTQHALVGAHGAISYFGAISSGAAHAVLRWTRGGSGPLAFQLNVFMPSQPVGVGNVVRLAAVRGSSTAVVEFVADTGGVTGKLRVSFVPPSTSIELGPAAIGGWKCIELFADTSSFSVAVGPNDAGSVPVALGATGAELGMDMPGQFNDHSFFYDEIVAAPAPIGCLHP